MISADLQVYTQEIFNFLKTVTVKFSPMADLENNKVIRKGYTVNLDEPSTWKYNLNAIGEYHESDTPMTVLSFDTKETIVFNKENLALHPRTKAAYLPGTTYFETLCDTYSDQEQLIKSILFPYPDMADWLSLSDFSLAQYGTGYLETWEEPELIRRLIKFLEVIRYRWYFSFLSVEPYFTLTFYGQLYTQMGAHLLVSRDSLIRTPYVHSWHIQQYLQSNGLDDYSDVLTRKKQMFLYQNWEYLKLNMGKQSNLELLITNLLSDINIGVYGRKVIQQKYTAKSSYQLTPQLGATNVSADNVRLTAIADESVADMQTKIYEAGLIPTLNGNDSSTVTRTLGDTTLNEWFTKYLELRPTTADSRYNDMLNRFILDTLTQTCVKGYYNAVATVDDPLTGHTETMTVADRLLLYAYCSAKSIGATLVNLPTEYISQYALRDTFITPDTTYPHLGYNRRIASYLDAQSFMTSTGYDTLITTAAGFSSNLTTLWSIFLNQIEVCEITDDTFLYNVRMYLMWCRYKHYEIIPLNLAPGQTTFSGWLNNNYPEWLIQFTDVFDTSNDPQTAYSNLADVVISSLVPTTDTLSYYGNYTVSNASYARLKALFVQLCSYNVNFVDYSGTNSEYVHQGKLTYDSLGDKLAETVYSSTYLKDEGVATVTYTDEIAMDASGILLDGDITLVDTDTMSYELIDNSLSPNGSDIFYKKFYASMSGTDISETGYTTTAIAMNVTSLAEDTE